MRELFTSDRRLHTCNKSLEKAFDGRWLVRNQRDRRRVLTDLAHPKSALNDITKIVANKKRIKLSQISHDATRNRSHACQ